MATATAGARVASTTELLEAILLNLNHDEIDLKTLLVSQRVSTTFRNTIRGSLKLRQALYLEPPTALRGDNEVRSGMNPLLRLDTPGFDFHTPPYSKWRMTLPLNSQREFSISIRADPGKALLSMDDTVLLPTTNVRGSSPLAMSTIPSWKKMHVFQWPVTSKCRNQRGSFCHVYTNPKFGDIAHRNSDNNAPPHGLQLMNWTFKTK